MATYSPLPDAGGDYIRLLQVHRHKAPLLSFKPPTFSFSFKVVCISNDDLPPLPYMAVSYAWGPEGAAPVQHIPLTNGGSGSGSGSGAASLPLSPSLAGLFASLLSCGTQPRTTTLWIDALCINQADTHEKSSQVALMGHIYSRAERVLVWLGDSDAGTRAAFRFMRARQALPWPGGWEADARAVAAGVGVLFAVLARPYFQRVWVIQEVALGRDVVMACGGDRVGFAAFQLCVSAVWKFFEGWDDLDGESDARRGLSCATGLIEIRDAYRQWGYVRYEILLQAALHCRATDERDMVFAFRGIGDRERSVPAPDYDVRVEEVYIQTAVALLTQGGSLDSLALTGVEFRPQPSNLPSWVPDLRYRSYDEPFDSCNRAGWDAGGPAESAPPPVFAAPDGLRLRVRLLDTVAVACTPFNSFSVAEQQAALAGVLALKQRLPAALPQEDFLDGVSAALLFGLDIDDKPLGATPAQLATHRAAFAAWLTWLRGATAQADLTRIHSNAFQRTVGVRVDGWKALMTRGGVLCIGPAGVEIGDALCVVPGCRFPVVLRRVGKEGKGGKDKYSVGEKDGGGADGDAGSMRRWTLVSWCFALGIMHGEARGKGREVDVWLK